MSDLMKRSKGYDNEKRKIVLTKFKTVYKEKKNGVPQGFKAVKNNEKYVIVDENAEKVDEEPKQSKPLKVQPQVLKDRHNSNQAANAMDVFQDSLTPVVPKSSKQSRSSESSGEIKLESSSQKQTLPTSTSKSEIKPEQASQKQNLSSTKSEKKEKILPWKVNASHKFVIIISQWRVEAAVSS
mmetsp:Transcript_25708/g.56550  ORF Transcript_25708/g.56550 Transcript_25708/m.56550 type:complete len:183 (+) Transcript_25708:3-551(+)